MELKKSVEYTIVMVMFALSGLITATAGAEGHLSPNFGCFVGLIVVGLLAGWWHYLRFFHFVAFFVSYLWLQPLVAHALTR